MDIMDLDLVLLSGPHHPPIKQCTVSPDSTIVPLPLSKSPGSSIIHAATIPWAANRPFPSAKRGLTKKTAPTSSSNALPRPIEVVPHLAANHAVNPVPVQPTGLLFYRAKHFNRRNLWNLIYSWDNNLFRFIVKHIHADIVGRTENCNLLIAHIQYRQTGRKFDGLVSSTLKALESQCAKDDIFVTTFHRARDYTDKWGNLNFIIQMRKIQQEIRRMPCHIPTSHSSNTLLIPKQPSLLTADLKKQPHKKPYPMK
ncbi:E3 ubiquitin-protein ligase [Caligus rogercresseyi]|uniref:E3 ubiquitin-protein ligase n=1 Tax=Caligus rogercresseyi TaxID=217165 RepID=A0A7T8H191_CALRO|nr:E3 ubiquitin-protein ligase [Caligus rogercresseyi]